MNLLVIIFAVAGLTALSWVGVYLYELVANDGYGRSRSHQPPPRSHEQETFDPHLYA